MIDSGLKCKQERRREAVRMAPLFGLDYVEVNAPQTTLTVFFLGKAPARIEKDNVAVSGGIRIKGIQVTGVTLHRHRDPNQDDWMEVRVNRAGDFSTYTLSVIQVASGFDPRYAEVDFTFKASCPTGLDCKPQSPCPPAQRTHPEIDYLARDYSSFRELIVDRLALIMPGWQETHEPDIGVALVELLAYAGDYLSYYQDAVATEAYLATARQRISVRRHVRLIDYAMHEGCNARAWIALWTDADRQFDPSQIYFITAFPGAPATQVLNSAALVNVPTSSYEVFQPLLPASGLLPIYQAHSEIGFYTWGDELCCIAPGATSATLVDSWLVVDKSASGSGGPPQTARSLRLQPGDVLIFEEVLGPKTGQPSDADPSHRQAVRLTKVTAGVDPLYHPYGDGFGQPIVEIEWSAEDALTFPLCISARMPPPACTLEPRVSVARGNVLLVDHGASTGESLGTVATDTTTVNCPSPCDPALVLSTPRRFRPVLTHAPLTFSQPLAAGCSATVAMAQDPRQALPEITLISIPPAAPVDASQIVAPMFGFEDLTEPFSLAQRLKRRAGFAAQRLDAQLKPQVKKMITAWDGASPLPAELSTALRSALDELQETWLPIGDLLESGANDSSFVVEMDNDGHANLRFGDGRLGRTPDAGTAFQATYRVGNGTAGNVGAETLTYLVMSDETLSGANILPRNPLPASGGTAMEPIAEVKLFAPHAFQDVIERAVVAGDYAALAADNLRRQEQRTAHAAVSHPFVPLQGAKATLRWTGSWYEALVAIDPVGAEQASAEVRSEVRAYLEPYRRIGHDLTVDAASYVPLDLAVSVCVLPDYLRGNVKASLLEVLGDRVQADGSTGLFHPDNLTFGGGVYVSRIVAAAQAVTGVASVSVTRLQRYQIDAHPFPAASGIASGAVPPLGVLTLGLFEIAQLDNDPNCPERGRLELTVRGGR